MVAGRDAKEEFKAKRIPGSQFFDIDGVANTSIPLPHMVPSEAAFSAAASALGVGPEDTVVLYDGVGNWSSPRAWWTWKAFGHERRVPLLSAILVQFALLMRLSVHRNHELTHAMLAPTAPYTLLLSVVQRRLFLMAETCIPAGLLARSCGCHWLVQETFFL
ncbi:MAG: hypothetical protein HC767_12760 [Akkermansiaceae bacterium]|nr:hypothetical protein [Akkermansiaceae bacterium]